jgi:hypothetical protein
MELGDRCAAKSRQRVETIMSSDAVLGRVQRYRNTLQVPVAAGGLRAIPDGFPQFGGMRKEA